MLTPEELRAAKAAAALRYQEIGRLLAEEAGVETIRYRAHNVLAGKAWVSWREIEAPRPTTRNRLYIFAHECGHVALGHDGTKPRHLKELEAEKWAHAALRRHGVAVPRKMTKRAKNYVKRRIREDASVGVKITREAVMFSNYPVKRKRS